MARIDPKYDPINRSERDKREDLIHSKKPDEVIEQMFQNFVGGIEELQKRIKQGETDAELATTRERLGNAAWGLEHLYGYDLTKFRLKSLGIIPNRGKSISRGSK